MIPNLQAEIQVSAHLSSSLCRGDAVLLVDETSNQRTTVTNSSLLLASKTSHIIYMEVKMRMPELNSRIQKLCLEKLWRRWRWREREREREAETTGDCR